MERTGFSAVLVMLGLLLLSGCATGMGPGAGKRYGMSLFDALARVSGLSDFFHIQWRSSATLTGT